MHKIRGAIQRIDDPAGLAIESTSPFLCEDRNLWRARLKDISNGTLSRQINLGDQIDRTLLVDRTGTTPGDLNRRSIRCLTSDGECRLDKLSLLYR